MALNDQDRALLQKQLKQLEDTLAEEQNASTGIQKKIDALTEDDNFFRKEWVRYNGIILNYEKEITSMNGQYVQDPITEKDLEDHARETGRLYQPTVSLDPKVIQQFVGEPILNQDSHELSNFTPLEHVIDTILNGEDGGPAFTPTELYTAYTAGNSTFVTVDQLDPNTWYLLGGDTLVKVSTSVLVPGGPSGSCAGETPMGSGTTEALCLANGGVWTPGPVIPDTYLNTISERYFLTGLDVNVAINETVETWGGYSNTERTSKVATSTTQRFFDVLLDHLETYVTKWKQFVETQRGALTRNTDEDMNLTDKQTTLDTYDYLVTYLATLPLQDGSGGIDGLSDQITLRQGFIPTRVVTAGNAKKAYYGDRVNFSKLRTNIQKGTLSRLIFLKEDIQTSFPPAGNPETIKRIKSIKALLAE